MATNDRWLRIAAIIRGPLAGCATLILCACNTGGAYEAGLIVSGASLEDTLEVVREASVTLMLTEDARTTGLFRTPVEGGRSATRTCGFVVVRLQPSTPAGDTLIRAEQSCGPGPEPPEYLEVLRALRERLEARFGNGQLRDVAPRYRRRV